MPKITVNVKELKSILKTYGNLSNLSAKRKPIVTFAFDPLFRIMLANETVFVSSTPSDTKDWDKETTSYHLHPEVLQQLKLKGKYAELSWTDPKGPLVIKDGKFSSQLRISAPAPDFKHYSGKVQTFQIPETILGKITGYLSIPFAYYKGNKDYTPVILSRDEKGFLVASSDDNYSLGRVETNFPVPIEFNAIVPKYILDNLYGSDLTGQPVNIGFGESGLYMESHSLRILFPNLNDKLNDFINLYNSNSPSFVTSYNMDPKKLLDSIDPLHSLSGDNPTLVYETQIKEEGISLLLRNREVGDASIESLDGVSEIFNERGLKNTILHLPPKALYEFTKLISPINNVKVMANSNLMYYEGVETVEGYELKTRFMFPTVQV